ncbi:MAG: SpoIIE family protein phosphatase [Bernardetiaceae bacterium]
MKQLSILFSLLVWLWLGCFFQGTLRAQNDPKLEKIESEVSKWRTENNEVSLMRALYSLGRYHYKDKRAYDESLPALKEAFTLSRGQNNLMVSSDIAFDLGQVYSHKKDNTNAYFYFSQAVQLRKSIKDINPNILGDATLYAGKSAIGAGKYNEAIKFLEETVRIGEVVGRKTLMQQAYDELASAYAHIGDTDKERAAREAAKKLFAQDVTSGIVDERQKGDSTRRELNKKVNELERTKREIERKQKELAETENRLDSLIADKEQQLKILEKKEAELLRKEEELAGVKGVLSLLKNTTIGISIVLLLSFAIGLWFYRTYKARLRLNRELAAKNEEIEAQRDLLMEQHKKMNEQKASIEKLYTNVQSSINYAQRIQFAMLPSQNVLRENFKDAFVFLQPRDPVSGDFYWMRRVANKVIIAAVDCTGHGVPGAFMSLIGNDLLNTIVVERKVLDPAQILDQMNEGVRESLKQNTSRNNDGMDIALCVVDEQAHTVAFAGAKNPLYYLNGTGEIQIIKGDRHPVGGTQGELERTYTQHLIQTQPGEEYTFYLFSDGFQDQFGGEEGRKFLRSNFKNLLQEIHVQPMSDQQQILEQRLNDWMGKTHRQIDDVLVLGFKV